MSKILVFFESSQDKHSALLAGLQSALPKDTIVSLKNTADLANHLKMLSYSLMVFILESHPSDTLMDVISSSKNISHARNIQMLAYIHNASFEGIQKALMMGAKSIFVNPIQIPTVIRSIKNLFEGNSNLQENQHRFFKVAPIPCRIDIFGRVGKIFLMPMGDLQIETDAKLPVGKAVTLRSGLIRDLSLVKLKYAVSEATSFDTYYQYQYSYRLALDADSNVREKVESWIAKYKTAFALPKTKVLWIRNTIEEPVPVDFDKTLFSVHVQIPGKATQAYLTKLNPRILIVGSIPPASKSSLKEWLKNQGEKLVVSTDKSNNDEKDWRYVGLESLDQFKSEFLNLAKPFLKDRVTDSLQNAKYLSRKSNYSRCAISEDGWVTSISKSQVHLELSVELEKNTVILAHCPPLEESGRPGVYLKVGGSSPIENSKKTFFRHICEILPASDQPNQAVFKWIRLLEGGEVVLQSHVTVHSEDLAQTAKKDELFFLKKAPIVIDLMKVSLGLIVAAMLLALIYWLMPHGPIKGANPTSSEEFFGAIRKAFK